ncbi:MAG TPA: Na(+)-translocating NADH-quinone reductase subunit A [Candidatus Hydrogenedentes bacterium]|nr:Na(+)-translocating NADH-quinone reductase subunit A [Candidatus Hydrogenedentota bacterium]HOZ49317.1 Na(+)-translocating NADH-quinone reductase subunit A [Candidatus Hydrogenedentota bacterium]HPG69670.1 Na(+)-translocating NADH-quinone reductase subunit A [Candidatus Hydrogenedentota bacterium]
MHKITKGLDLPITGEPEQTIHEAARPRRVAIIAGDYVGLRPRMLVSHGDEVKRGQALFEEKKAPGVLYTAPGAGRVSAINRGARRALQTVVIDLNEREMAGERAEADEVQFASYTGKDPVGVDVPEIKALLLESGLWTALRARPYGKVARPDTKPHSIFVTAMDTNPLAPLADVVYLEDKEHFQKGLICVARLTEGKTYLCKAPATRIDAAPYSGIEVEEFGGVHPAGNVGTHIHFLDPVSRDRTVWHIGYQDVIAIGKLFATGRLDVTRVVSLAGPMAKRPRLLRARIGASTDALVEGELKEGPVRVISGSVFNGRTASGPVHGFLGRYHHQVTLLREGSPREFLGWLMPGRDKYSVTNAYVSCIDRSKKYGFTTSLNGAERAILPIGVYERVMPLDILPTFLLRSLIAGDLERAEELGCLELDEEDLALCTFVSPSKIDYGPVLRRVLTEIEKEG